MAEISGLNFFRYPFAAICDLKHLVEYTVMDVEIIRERKLFPGQGPISFKHVVADIWVVKTSELGIKDNKIHMKSQLGHLLKPGDTRKWWRQYGQRRVSFTIIFIIAIKF